MVLSPGEHNGQRIKSLGLWSTKESLWLAVEIGSTRRQNFVKICFEFFDSKLIVRKNDPLFFSTRNSDSSNLITTSIMFFFVRSQSEAVRQAYGCARKPYCRLLGIIKINNVLLACCRQTEGIDLVESIHHKLLMNDISTNNHLD